MIKKIVVASAEFRQALILHIGIWWWRENARFINHADEAQANNWV